MLGPASLGTLGGGRVLSGRASSRRFRLDRVAGVRRGHGDRTTASGRKGAA